MPGTPQYLSAGQRDRTIVIEQMTSSVGPSQFPVEAWTPLVSLGATLTVDGGGETFAAAQLSATDAATWTIPYRADCDPETGIDVPRVRRVVYAGRVYDVLSAEPIGRRAGLTLRTRAKVG